MLELYCTRNSPGWLLWLTLIISVSGHAWAQSAAPPVDERQAELLRIRADLDAQQQAMPKKLAELQAAERLDPQWVKQAELGVRTARLQLDNLQVEYAGTEQELAETSAAITELEARLRELRQPGAEVGREDERAATLTAEQSRLAQQRDRQQRAQRQRDYLKARLALAETKLALEQEWQGQLQTLYQARQGDQLQTRLADAQQAHLQRAAELRERLDGLQDTAEPTAAWRRHLVETQIQEAEERAQLAARQVRLAHAREQLAQLAGRLAGGGEPQARQEVLRAAQALQEEVRGLHTLAHNKLEVFQAQSAIMEAPEDEALSGAVRKLAEQESKLLDALRDALAQQAGESGDLLAQAEELQSAAQARQAEETRRTLLTRRTLPATPQGWEALLTEFWQVPAVLLGQFQVSLRTAYQDWREITWGHGLGVTALALFWLGGLLWGKRLAERRLGALLESRRETHTLAYNSLVLTLRLMHMNQGGIALAGLLGLLLWVTQPAASSVALVLSLMGIWLGIKLPVNLAWLLLAARDVPDTYRSPGFYRQLRWVLLLTGALAGLTLAIHVLPFSLALRDLSDSVFLLFLSLLVLPGLLRVRRMLLLHLTPERLHPRWLFTVRLLSLLAPLSLLAVAGLGLAGYISLGWAVGQVLGWFLLTLTGWLLARGLLADLAVFLRNYAVARSPNYGLLWSQDLIPLTHKIARVGLILLAVLLFLKLNGWQTDTGFTQAFLDFPLLSVGGTTLSVAALLFSALGLLIVFWLGSWSRQITYRWIYLGVSDLGVRNSLSVFTQYAVIFFGGLVTLRLIGLDLTTVAVFAGAVGVGLGLGLQNIANNFFSGLLLLVERPLRTGDIVQVGDNVGEVTKIGIRSLNIKNWDSQDVIVPNSEVISSTFTNFTHSDTLLRTVLMIGIGYGSDPRVAMAEIKRILEAHPAVLKDPAYLVTLWEFADSAITLRAHYYANLRQHNLLEVRSEILLAVLECFAARNIEIPYPQRDIHVKTYPREAARAPAAGGLAL